jgi:hypothetical protein
MVDDWVEKCCSWCNAPFWVKPWKTLLKSRFCSQHCQIQFNRRKQAAPPLPEEVFGPDEELVTPVPLFELRPYPHIPTGRELVLTTQGALVFVQMIVCGT